MKVKNNEKFFPMTSGEQIRDFLDIKIAYNIFQICPYQKRSLGL